MSELHRNRDGESVPTPDPTVLTREALQRDIDSLRELMEARLSGMKESLDTRLNGMDQAVKLLQVSLTQAPHETDGKINNLHSLIIQRFNTIDERFKVTVEQFRGIENQFIERDVRVKDSAAAATTAVNAALQAAKEAVGEQNKSFTLSIDKSEKSTLEQINQQRILLQTNYAALNDKITAIDTRLTRFEGLGLGTAAATSSQREEKTSQQQSNSWILALAVAGVSFFFGAAAFVIEMIRTASGK